MLAVLRMWGPNLDLDRSVQQLPCENVQKVWRAGELGRGGKRNTTSGLTILLSDSDSGHEVVGAVANALLRMAPFIGEVTRHGASAQVDVALFVASSEPRSISFGPSVLRAMSQAGVEITVSAYPTEPDDEGA